MQLCRILASCVRSAGSSAHSDACTGYQGGAAAVGGTGDAGPVPTATAARALTASPGSAKEQRSRRPAPPSLRPGVSHAR